MCGVSKKGQMEGLYALVSRLPSWTVFGFLLLNFSHRG
jgi:hypothetical protein